MVKWTPKSEKDLEEIMEYIANHFNIDLAVEAVEEIMDQVEFILSKNPLVGSILKTNPLFSKLVIKGNSVFYCENPKDRDLYVVYIRARKSDLKLQRLTNEEIT